MVSTALFYTYMIHENHFVSMHVSTGTHMPAITLLTSPKNVRHGNVTRINCSIYGFEKLNARDEIQTINTNTNSNKKNETSST